MSNPFEKQKTSPNEKLKVDTREEATAQKNHSDSIRKAIEYKTGKKLPEDKEELFRNFDELIPKEINHIDIADKVKLESEHASLYRYSREGMKSNLERELYGSTMKEVDDYFRNELEAIEKELEKTQRSKGLGYKDDFDPKLPARHDKYVDLFNQISAGVVGNPLAEIELQINSNFTNESEKDNLRKFAERLSAEMYKDRPKNKIDVGDIKKQIKKEAVFFSDTDDENVKNDNEKHFKSVLENLDNGDLASASKEIEFNIGWIQERLEERKNPDLKDVSEKMLKKRYGENFMPAVNEELGKLREYRKFLRSGETTMEKQVESADYIPEKEDELLKAIEIEDKKGSANYFETVKKVEGLEQGEAELIWAEIGNKLKEMGVFTNLEQEGIDIFKSEKNWKAPYEIRDLSREMTHERLGSDYANIGGYYENGEVFISERDKNQDGTKDNLSRVASGLGIGGRAETLIHETYHGFQDISPNEIKSYKTEKSELEDKIKTVELESRILGKPPYDLTHLNHRKSKLEDGFAEKMKHPELDTEEKIIDRKILMEIHAHLFSDPLRYAAKLKSCIKEDIENAYFEFPVKKIYEDIIGISRNTEDKNKIYRYDYMKGRNEQAFVAFRQIEALRTLGLNNLEIGQLISKSEYDKEKNYYKNLREKIVELREKNKMTKEELDSEIDKFRLSTIFKALKSRNLAKEIIEKHLS